MIVWISSYPKSGNTWMRALLAYYFFSKTKKFDFSLLKYIPNFNVSDFIHEKKPLKTNEDIIENWIPVQKFINEKFKRNLFFKTHNICITNNGKKFTNNKVSAGCIYIVRDPRNVITSYKNFENETYDKTQKNIFNENHFLLSNESTFKRFGIKGIEVIGSWSHHYNSWVHNKLNIPVCLIKYEDLIKNPSLEFEKVFNFLKVINNESNTTIDENRLKETIGQTDFKNLKNLEEDVGFLEKQNRKVNFFNQGVENDWKKILPRNISVEIEKKFENEMRELGYL